MIEIPPLWRASVRTLQVNVGALCNQRCVHCHQDAGPDRRELMSEEVVRQVLDFVRREPVERLDITGGAPELNPHLPSLITGVRPHVEEILVRSNLTALYGSDHRTLLSTFKENRVTLVCSLPCYLKENVDEQRGRGVYDRSIEMLKRLNRHGYGLHEELRLDLVYNPGGPFLPPDQTELEEVYRNELKRRHGLVFNRLITLTNMPINRFRRVLERTGGYETYLELLAEHYNPRLVELAMCRSLLSVGYDGSLYDCDFNLALGMGLTGDRGQRLTLQNVSAGDLCGREIRVGEHCLGCLAGAGSSCFGALGKRGASVG
jgi:radical SAM/Cys-rich protein